MVSTLPDLVVPQQYREVVERIAATAADLARTHRRRLGEARCSGSGRMPTATGRRALDLMADEAFRTALTGAGVRFYASEEQDRVVELDPDGDARAGDRSARRLVEHRGQRADRHDLRASTAAEATAEASFLRPGRQLARRGLRHLRAALLPRHQLRRGGAESISSIRASGRFRLAQAGVTLPAKSAEFAINASNYRHWDPAIRAYVDDCVAGTEGPRERRLQHALDRLAGRRGAPDPDPRRHLPLPARRAEGLRARAAAAASTSARRSPS